MNIHHLHINTICMREAVMYFFTDTQFFSLKWSNPQAKPWLYNSPAYTTIWCTIKIYTFVLLKIHLQIEPSQLKQ
jgi:hypothetical protein